MRAIKALGLCLACVSMAGGIVAEGGTDSASRAYPPQILRDTEIRVLPRTRPDRQYQLHIGLPASFKANPTKKYPVVFVTDGYYDFPLVLATYSNLTYDRTVPEAIVVGLGYAGDNPDYERLRMDDLMPMALLVGRAGNSAGGGQADRFLDMIETVAIPFLEREYRADPGHRMLVGCSSGGLFALYALFTRPHLFQGYVAASPFVSELWQYEDEFARSGETVDARVFLSTGEFEPPSYHNSILLFDQRLSARKYFKGGYRFLNIENMRHVGEKAEAFTQGLQYVFEATAPESGVSAERFGADPTREVYEIVFSSLPPFRDKSQWSPDQLDAMSRHRQSLEEQLKAGKIIMILQTPDGNAKEFSSVLMRAKDRDEAGRFAAAEPAVSSGLVTFEVIPLTGSHASQGK